MEAQAAAGRREMCQPVSGFLFFVGNALTKRAVFSKMKKHVRRDIEVVITRRS